MPVNSRHDQAGDAHLDDRQPAEHHQDQPEQLEASLNASLLRPACSSSVKIGNERGRSAACENRLVNRFGIWEAIVNAEPPQWC